MTSGESSGEGTDPLALYLELTDGVPGALFRYILHDDGSDGLDYISRGCVDIWEVEPKELMNDPSPLWQMVFEEDIYGLGESIKQSAALQIYWSHEWRIQTPSGAVKWLNGSGTPKLRDNGDCYWNSVIIDVTHERHARKALDSFFEQDMALNLIVDLSGRIIRCNRMWEKTLGYSRAELEGVNYTDFVHPDDIHFTIKEGERRTAADKDSHKFETRYRHKNGSYRLLAWSSVASPEEELIYAVAADITDHRIAEDKLRQAATVLKSTAEGVMITGLDKTIIEVNKAFTEITGYSESEAVGQKPSMLSSGRHNSSFYNKMWREIEKHGFWHGEIWNRHKDGSVFPELMTISTVCNEQGRIGYSGVFSDISALKAHQEELEYLAHHDSLTGLPNRLLFNSRLDHSLEMAERNEQSLAVIFIDLDQFKNINDSMGHPSGDELLLQAAKRLQKRIRSSDLVARMGGDEFVVILENIEGPEYAGQVAAELMNAFTDSFQIQGSPINVSCSMGLSLFPQDSQDRARLLANADAAMFEAKALGRNTYAFYSEASNKQANDYIALENALRQALNCEQFFLHYQPQINIEDETLIGMEALIRWHHSSLGNISPGRFIPIAEQNGTIRKIGQWVLATACAQGRAWLDAGLQLGRISVNVAASEFQSPTFADDVLAVLTSSGLPAKNLELEVTESFVMVSPEKAIPKLQKLREAGVTVAIDDFGTGYSSLSYLKKLPVDKLKIDQSFINDLPDDEDQKAIVDAIISLGRTLKLEVIAEGIETLEQVEFLKSQHIQGQGYYFSKPLVAADMECLMRSR